MVRAVSYTLFSDHCVSVSCHCVICVICSVMTDDTRVKLGLRKTSFTAAYLHFFGGLNIDTASSSLAEVPLIVYLVLQAKS